MTNQITDEEFQKTFKMKPAEIVEYFSEKGLKPSFDWHEVYEDAHAKAFTVAKMTELNLLKDTKDLLQKALDEGKSYSSFKKEAMELFNKKGWIGFKEVTDPKTGETKTVELGTPRRIKQIYDCNMNSAYAVGRYKEMLEEADVAPYWQYKSLMDGRERQEHRALHNKVFKCDDPFWNIFFPPNGWGCRCYVVNLSKREVEKQGLTVESSEGRIKDTTVLAGGELRPIESYTFNHDGRKITLTPDAGWGTNLGVKAWGLDVQAWNKVENLPEKVKYQFISKMAENPHKKAEITKLIDSALSHLSKPQGKKEIAAWLMPDIFSVLIKEDINFKTPLIGIKEGDISHFFGDRKKIAQRLSKEQLYQIYDILNKPDEIYLDKTDNSLNFVKNLKPDEIKDKRDCIKINVKIDKSTKKEPVNFIGSAARVNKNDSLNKPTMKKIFVGRSAPLH